MGDGAWDSFPDEIQRVLTQNGAALLAELHYVDEPMPDAAAFANIDVPVLLVAASDSPREQRDMTERMAEALPKAHLVRVGGGHLVAPRPPRYSPSSRNCSKPDDHRSRSRFPARQSSEAQAAPLRDEEQSPCPAVVGGPR